MNPVRNGIIGVAIGDMLGVPVEGLQQVELEKNPVTDVREHGSHDQPKGAWSDDTSLTLCLADSLVRGFSLEDMAKTFLRWKVAKEWTAHDCVFDIGRQTNNALNNLYKILESGDAESLEYLHYEANEDTNGNGSLMRILPLYFYLQRKGMEENFDTVWNVSALTHPHIRSAYACLMYLIMLEELTQAEDIHNAYLKTAKRMREFFESRDDVDERIHFSRLIDNDISTLNRKDIYSGAYVIETLEASFWCLLNTRSYKDAVLEAVNLGYDTDTTGAVTGGLAGFFYGIDTAPIAWYESVARIADIEKLCDLLEEKYPGKQYQPSPLITFLSGSGKDSNKRTLEDVLSFSDTKLENEHDYIQWLFPLREQSGAIWDAPTLSNVDITYASKNTSVQDNFSKGLERITAFYLSNDHWLTPDDHNHLRITRILKSTRLILGKEKSSEFYSLLLSRIQEKDANINPKNMAYWHEAMGL